MVERIRKSMSPEELAAQREAKNWRRGIFDTPVKSGGSDYAEKSVGDSPVQLPEAPIDEEIRVGEHTQGEGENDIVQGSFLETATNPDSASAGLGFIAIESSSGDIPPRAGKSIFGEAPHDEALEAFPARAHVDIGPNEFTPPEAVETQEKPVRQTVDKGPLPSRPVRGQVLTDRLRSPVVYQAEERTEDERRPMPRHGQSSMLTLPGDLPVGSIPGDSLSEPNVWAPPK